MKNIKTFIKNIDKYKLLIFTCIAIGIFLRILFYSYNRPLWNDECALALSIQNTWNFFQPLQYNQAAPQLFMYLSKLIYMCPPPEKELLLRIIPLISSIISLILFYVLSAKFLVKKFSALISVLMFSLCYPICYYAQEFKQYSTDILCSIIVLLSYFYIRKHSSDSKKILLFGFMCALIMHLSFPSAFTICGLFMALLLFDKKLFMDIKISLIPIVISCIIYYFINIHLHINTYLNTYWESSFITWNFSNLYTILKKCSDYFFDKSFPLYLILFTVVFSLKKNNKNILFYILLFPLLITLGLAYFKIYPFSSRLIMFITPECILLGSKAFDFINLKNKYLQIITVFIISLLFILPAASQTYNNIIKKQYFSEDILTPLKTAAHLADENAIIYIPQGNQILYEYYKNKINTNARIIVENNEITDEDYINNLESLENNKTYYYVYAHYKAKKKRLKSVYEWAKQKNNFKFYIDNNLNALIIFTK